MQIELTSEEVNIVRDLIESRISELGTEIHHTRTRDYREELKVLREKLKRLEHELANTNS